MADLVTWVLVAALTVAILAIFLLIRQRSNPNDGRLGMLDERTDSMSAILTSAGNQVVAIEERTKKLQDAYEQLSTLEERTKKLQEAYDGLATLQERTNPLQGFITDASTKLRTLSAMDRRLDELHGIFRTTAGKGQVGEDAVRNVLKQFPDDVWEEKLDLPTGTVDFAVHTPNGLVLPIDSKAGASDVIRGYLETLQRVVALEEDDEANPAELEAAKKEVQRLTKDINDKVKKSGKEIRKYIVPEKNTTSFVLQAVPDAVYEVLEPRNRKEISEGNVLTVPYSLLHAAASTIRHVESQGELDLRKVGNAIQRVKQATDQIEEAVKNSVERASTMAKNAADTIRGELNSIRTATLQVEMLADGEEDS